MNWLGLFWTHVVTFWSASFFCFAVDMHDPCTVVTRKAYFKAAKRALLVQTAVHLPLSLLLDYFGIAAVPLPPNESSFESLVWQVPLAVLLADVLFYYVHRLFHLWPWLYKSVHSYHHQWVLPVGVAALDTHPVEHLLCNLLPIGLGFWAVGMNATGAVVSVASGTLNLVLLAHGGFSSLSDGHDLHHLVRTCNFGIGPVMVLDRLHGTYRDRDRVKVQDTS